MADLGCIYCGKDTGSREHLFPASLGGRRVNKGILCGNCNQSFSSLDAILADQLRSLNGHIGVRGDRRDQPHLATGTTGDGRPVNLDANGRPYLTQPEVLEEEQNDDGTSKITLAFASQRDADEWVAEQRALGKHVASGPRVHTSEFLGPVKGSLEIGGAEMLRAVARVAVNHLAHWQPTLARSPALDAVKAYILGSPCSGNLAWWTTPGTPALPEPKFVFGHQIMVVISGTRGHAYARVRLFDVFDITVLFGAVQWDVDFARLLAIDPLADNPPNDIAEFDLSQMSDLFALAPPTRGEAVDAVAVQAGLTSLFEKIALRNARNAAEGLIVEVNRAVGMSPADRVDTIFHALQSEQGRILILAQKSCSDLANSLTERSFQELFLHFSEALTPSAAFGSGLSSEGQALLTAAQIGVAQSIAEELETGPISQEQLARYLQSGDGVAAAGRGILKVLVSEA